MLTTAQALQLLEDLVKHGSERVVDDARSHISTIKMLRNFHYIDDKGKDQGINGAPPTHPLPIHPPTYAFPTHRSPRPAPTVRNRSRELAEGS